MKNTIAIFVCGSGGSGKSTFIKNNLNTFVHIDVDIIYERLLIESGLGLKIIDFDTDKTKYAYSLFEKAKIENDELFYNSVSNSKNIVIDGIGRDSDIILNQRKYLENCGYDTFIIIMYADLEICIKRVEMRDRVYKQIITEDSWYLSYNNIGTYKKEFGDKFTLIYNNNIFVLDDFIKLKHNKNLI
jgi:dephospho-CoA kinase